MSVHWGGRGPGHTSRLAKAATSVPADETPDAFAFTDVTGATTSTQYTSDQITVAGLGSGVSVAVTITGGTYSKNGGGYTASAGTAENGDTFTVRQTSSANGETATDVVLTIGGVSDTYRVTTAWLPTNVSGLQLWIDPADAATVTTSTGRVTQITDKSGNGRTFVRRGASGPQQTTVNSKSALAIITDGTQDEGLWRNNSDLNSVTSGPNTFAAIGAWNGVTNAAGSHFALAAIDNIAGAATNQTRGWVRFGSAPNGLSFRHGATATNSGTTIGSSGAIGVQTRSGTAIEGYQNGTSVVSATNGANFTTATGGVVIGGVYVSAVPTTFAFGGWVGDCIIYDSVLSQTNREKLEGYLAHKWGLQASLPGAHPYFGSPP